MRKIVLAGLAVFALAACATEEGYRQVLNSWIGARERELVSKWGPPHRFYESEGVRYLGYEHTRTFTTPATAPTYQTTMIGNTAYTTAIGGSPASSFTLKCMTVFEVTDSIVASYRFEGTDCRATPKK